MAPTLSAGPSFFPLGRGSLQASPHTALGLEPASGTENAARIRDHRARQTALGLRPLDADLLLAEGGAATLRAALGIVAAVVLEL